MAVMTVCCELHMPDDMGGCCDPDDCAPCCPACPTCPTHLARKDDPVAHPGDQYASTWPLKPSTTAPAPELGSRTDDLVPRTTLAEHTDPTAHDWATSKQRQSALRVHDLHTLMQQFVDATVAACEAIDVLEHSDVVDRLASAMDRARELGYWPQP